MPKKIVTPLNLSKTSISASANVTDCKGSPDLETLQSKFFSIKLDSKVDEINNKVDSLIISNDNLSDEVKEMCLEIKKISESLTSKTSVKVPDSIEIPDSVEEVKHGDEVIPIGEIKWNEYPNSWNCVEDTTVWSFVDAVKETSLSLDNSINIVNKAILQNSCMDKPNIYEKILFLNKKIFQDYREGINFNSQDKFHEVSILYDDMIRNIVDGIWYNYLDTIIPVIAHIGQYSLSIALVFEIATIIRQRSFYKGYFIPISALRNAISARLRRLYLERHKKERLPPYFLQARNLSISQYYFLHVRPKIGIIVNILKRGSLIFIRYSIVSLVSMGVMWCYLNSGNNLLKYNRLLSKAEGKMLKLLVELWMKYYKKW